MRTVPPGFLPRLAAAVVVAETRWGRLFLDAADNHLKVRRSDGTLVDLEAASSGVTGPDGSVDGEVALFSGTTGGVLKRAAITGLAKLASGVLSAAVAGTDYYAPGSTDVAVADGGTGSSTATAARSALGLDYHDGGQLRHAGTTSNTVLHGTNPGGGQTSTASISPNNLYLCPFVAPARGGTLDRLAIEIISGTGSVRLGLYDSTGPTDLTPGTLLVESAAIAQSGAGMVTHTLSQQLTPGRVYWVAVVTNAAYTIRTVTLARAGTLLGWPATGGTDPYWGVKVAHTFGALPTLSAPAFSAGGTIPHLLVRCSA